MSLNDFGANLESFIFRNVGLRTAVNPTKPGKFGEFKIRSVDKDFASPHGWQISVEQLAETALCRLSFDSEAKPLKALYLQRLQLLDTEFEETARSLQENGLKTVWETNGNVVPRSLIENNDSGDFSFVGGFSVGADTQEERVHNLKTRIAQFVGTALMPLFPDESESSVFQSSDEAGLPEGAVLRVEVNKYERNPKNRAACIAYYGSICQGCGFDFGSKYGPIGDGFIHVHHLTPISQLGPNYKINPLKDLVPLCPNCHAAVHLRKPPLAIEELRSILKKQ